MPSQDRAVQQQKPWHHTPAGIIFLVILSLFLIGGIIFIGLVGYYTWKIRSGDTEFAKEFIESSVTAGGQISPVFVEKPERLIHPDNPKLGPANAPVTIVMFVDFLCPYCQRSYPIVKQVQERYGDAVRLVFKQFPLESIHPGATATASAAACAHEQGKFWEYHDLLFTRKSYTETALAGYAQELGLDMMQFGSCIAREVYMQAIDQDLADGLEIGVQGTPTYIVNNRKIEGVVSFEAWNSLILELLQK